MSVLKISALIFAMITNSVCAEDAGFIDESRDKIVDVAQAVNETFTEEFIEVDKEQLYFNNEWDNVIAPFTNQSSLILMGGALGSYLHYNDRYEDYRLRTFNEEANKVKKWRDYGDLAGWGLLPIGYSLYHLGSNYFDPDVKKLRKVEYMMKTVIYTGLATLTLKLAIDQGRPKDKGKRDSFPSGHASSSFAFAGAIWMQYGWKYGLLASTAATWISYSRIDDGSHYYHDSIAGAALGLAYAIGIYNNHYGRELPFMIGFSPIPNQDGMMTTVSWNF